MRTSQGPQPAQLHEQDSPLGIPLVDHVIEIVEYPHQTVFIVDAAFASDAPKRSRVFWSDPLGCWLALGPNGEQHGGHHYREQDAHDHAARLDQELAEERLQHAQWLDQHYGASEVQWSVCPRCRTLARGIPEGETCLVCLMEVRD